MTADLAVSGKVNLLQRVAVFYNPHHQKALVEAGWLRDELTSRGVAVEVGDGWERSAVKRICPDRDLIVTYGGDGTIIRIASLAARMGLPVLGVNLGRVGFLADLTPEALHDRVDDLVQGDFWVESRTMLDANASLAGGALEAVALNEVAVARGPVPRAIEVTVCLNGSEVMTYSADGVLVVTATGSTAYSLAAGGPILYPEASDFMITPVAPHLHIGRSMLVPGDSTVKLMLASEFPAIISVDGNDAHELHPNDSVEVTRSRFTASFAHLRPSDYFYRAIAERL